MRYYKVVWSTMDVIPDPYKWVDVYVPYFIFALGFLIDAIVIYRIMS